MLAVISSSDAFAMGRKKPAGPPTFDFSFNGNTVGQYSMVTCDYAEYQVKRLFDAFGVPAKEIQCFGGLQNIGGLLSVTPLNLRVIYEKPYVLPDPNAVASEYEEHADDRLPACDFNTRMIRALVRELTPYVKIVKASDQCTGVNTRWFYRFAIQRKPSENTSSR